MHSYHNVAELRQIRGACALADSTGQKTGVLRYHKPNFRYYITVNQAPLR